MKKRILATTLVLVLCIMYLPTTLHANDRISIFFAGGEMHISGQLDLTDTGGVNMVTGFMEFVVVLNPATGADAIIVIPFDTDTGEFSASFPVGNPGLPPAVGGTLEVIIAGRENAVTNVVVDAPPNFSILVNAPIAWQAEEDYNPADATLTVRVNNNGSVPTGALTVEIGGAGAGNFNESTNTIPSIPVGGFYDLVITPIPGLTASSNRVITISIGNANVLWTGTRTFVVAPDPIRPAFIGGLFNDVSRVFQRVYDMDGLEYIDEFMARLLEIQNSVDFNTATVAELTVAFTDLLNLVVETAGLIDDSLDGWHELDAILGLLRAGLGADPFDAAGMLDLLRQLILIMENTLQLPVADRPMDDGPGAPPPLPTPTPEPTPEPTTEPEPTPTPTPEPTPTPTPASVRFNDVAANAWYHDYVTIVAHYGIMTGTDVGFEPRLNMTRAMFAQALANLDGVALAGFGSGTSDFADVASAAWYFAAVQWASDAGVIQGMGDGTFAPAASITREQIAVMLYRYANSAGIALPTGQATAFVDQGSISPWASNAVAAIQAAGIVSGRDDGTFDPQAFATRAEIAAIFARFLPLVD
jgi:hypothetical protein